MINISDQKFLKDVLTIGIAQAIMGIGGFLVLPLITKTLGSYSYGLWYQIVITISLLTSLSQLGLTNSMIRFLAAEKDPVKINEGFLSIVFFVTSLGLAFSLTVFFLSDIIALILFNDISISFLIKAGSFLILFNAVAQISIYYFRIFQQTIKFSIFTICQAFGQIFLMYVFISFGLGIFGAIIGSLLAQIFIFLLSIFFVIKEIGFAIPKFTALPLYLRYGLPLAPMLILDWLKNSNDRYLITFFLGIQVQGIYSAAFLIGSITMILVLPLQMILLHRLSQIFDENKLDQVINLLNDSVKYFALLALPTAFGLSFLAVPLLNIITTPDFSVGAPLIPFFAFGGVFFGLTQIWSNIMQLVKKTHIVLYVYLFIAILNISLNFILVPFMGILGAAISSFCSYLVMAVLTYLITIRYLKIHIDYKFFIKSMTASVLMGFALLLLHPITLVQITSSVILGILIYFSLLFIFKGFNKDEIKFAETIFLHFLGTLRKA